MAQREGFRPPAARTPGPCTAGAEAAHKQANYTLSQSWHDFDTTMIVCLMSSSTPGGKKPVTLHVVPIRSQTRGSKPRWRAAAYDAHPLPHHQLSTLPVSTQFPRPILHLTSVACV